MGILSNAIEQLANFGTITRVVTIGEMKIALKILGVEEQILSESILPNNEIRDKYKIDEKEFKTMNDTFAKYRVVSTLSYAIQSINGVKPVDSSLPLEEQHKQRMEFMFDLLKMNVTITDFLMAEYIKLGNQYKEFFNEPTENSGK